MRSFVFFFFSFLFMLNIFLFIKIKCLFILLPTCHNSRFLYNFFFPITKLSTWFCIMTIINRSAYNWWNLFIFREKGFLFIYLFIRFRWPLVPLQTQGSWLFIFLFLVNEWASFSKIINFILIIIIFVFLTCY